MANYSSENVKVKRAYTQYLEAAEGKQSATVDAALTAIERFEASTNYKPFSKFNIEQVHAFRRKLFEATGRNGQPLSAATTTGTLKHLKKFFQWLSREPGFRSVLNYNDANYFNPSDQDRRIASAHRDKPVATLDEIKATLAAMPSGTPIEKRDRAVLAFAILSGARDGAIASFRLKHIDLDDQTIFHDARIVKSKRRKTFYSAYFPVGPEPVAIVADYVAMLKQDLGFGPDDPLFPATRMGHDSSRAYVAKGLTRENWTTAEPIRRILRKAFAAAKLRSFNPHSLRDTLVRHMDMLNLTREEEKAYSLNFGHEHVRTTRESYGIMPAHHQQAVMRRIAGPRAAVGPEAEIAAVQAVLDRLRAGNGLAPA